MPVAGVSTGPLLVPEGYACVPLSEEQVLAPVRLCVLVRREADSAAGHFVALRSRTDARVLLGCLVDRGRVHRWVELWIQDAAGLADTPAVYQEVLSNAALDARWKLRFATLRETDGEALFETGWESGNPPPTYVRLSTLEPVHPVDDASGERWRLCTDDGVLSKRELPGYSASLHRYWHLPGQGEESPLVPVTPGAPQNEHTRPLEEVLGDDGDLLPLNPAAGFLTVREYCPVSLEEMVDLVGGQPWQGSRHGTAPLELEPASGVLKHGDADAVGGGWLFLGARGREGRLLEALHLKLRLFADAVRAVRESVMRAQLPLLNLSADSFGVRLSRAGAGLPAFWSARAVLCEPGDAVALPIGMSGRQYFARLSPQRASVYHPASAEPPVAGSGSVRIRQVKSVSEREVVIEGTLASQERIRTARNDLIWIRLDLAGGPVDLYGHRDEEATQAPGEYRFTTVGQQFSIHAVSALQAAEGVPVRNAAFQVLPMVSTPFDLYALGVLAVRTFLVNPQRPLPVVLDDVLSLTREVEAAYDDSLSLSARIGAIVNGDPSRAQALGPHSLTHDGLSLELAAELVPPSLWCNVLALVVRLFPGRGPDSECADLGDAPAGRIHQVFDGVQRDMEGLLVRTRNLVMVDWQFNREVGGVIQRYLEQSAAPAAEAAPAPRQAAPERRRAPRPGEKDGEAQSGPRRRRP